MKKTSFLKGLVMAAVALVCAFTTSCSEEELKINGSQITLPKASASLTVSIVDLEAGETLSVKTTDVTSAMGTDYKVVCELPADIADKYTTADPVTINIPKIADGQAVNIPVTFYVVKIESAFKEIWENKELVSTAAATPETITATNKEDDFINKTAFDVYPVAEFDVMSGMQFVPAAEGKAANTIEGILGEKLKFTVLKGTFKFALAPWCQATVKATQNFRTEVYKVEYLGEEKEVTVKVAENAMVEVSIDVIPEYTHEFTHNNHGHGHGHGTGNAGGGIITAE